MVVAAGADALCGALRVVGRGGLRGCVLGEGRFEWAIVKKPAWISEWSHAGLNRGP